jgi:hypothetical protein
MKFSLIYAIAVVGGCVLGTGAVKYSKSNGENHLANIAAAYVQIDAQCRAIDIAHMREVEETATGSGTFIFHKGRIVVLTARHVVKGSTGVKVIKKSIEQGITTTYDIDSWVSSGRYDLALVYIKEVPKILPVAEIAPRDTSLSQGDKVCYIGTPMRFHAIYGESEIAHPYFPFEGFRWLVTNGQAWHGHSGTAVYYNGKVIGVCSGGLWDDERSATRWVPLRDIYDFLDNEVK